MAQPASKLDPLLNQVDDIRLFLDAEKMPMFLASLSGHEGASASWDEALGGDWKKFVGAAKSMGAKSIYLNWERFQEAQFIDALATIEAGFVNSSGMDVEAKDVEKFRACIGLTAVIEIAFIVDGVAHWYEQVADWFKTFEELTEESELPIRMTLMIPWTKRRSKNGLVNLLMILASEHARTMISANTS